MVGFVMLHSVIQKKPHTTAVDDRASIWSLSSAIICMAAFKDSGSRHRLELCF